MSTKLRIVRVLHTGLPTRLEGTTVEGTRIARGYRLEDGRRPFYEIDDRWIGEGKQVELVEPDIDFYYGVPVP